MVTKKDDLIPPQYRQLLAQRLDDLPPEEKKRAVDAQIRKAKETLEGASWKLVKDYFTLESPPTWEYGEDEPPELTLQRYVHNRTKQHVWTGVAVALGFIATAFVGILFGGIPIANTILDVFNLASPVAESAANFNASVVGRCLTGAAVASVFSFGAGFWAFRTELKNNVDYKSLEAKQTAREIEKYRRIESPEQAAQVETQLDAIDEDRWSKATGVQHLQKPSTIVHDTRTAERMQLVDQLLRLR